MRRRSILRVGTLKVIAQIGARMEQDFCCGVVKRNVLFPQIIVLLLQAHCKLISNDANYFLRFLARKRNHVTPLSRLIR